MYLPLLLLLLLLRKEEVVEVHKLTHSNQPTRGSRIRSFIPPIESRTFTVVSSFLLFSPFMRHIIHSFISFIHSMQIRIQQKKRKQTKKNV